MLCAFYIWIPLFPSLFCTCHKIFNKSQDLWDGFLGSLGIWFHWDNLPLCGPSHFSYTFHISDVLCSFSCGDIQSTSRVQDALFYSLETASNFYFFGNQWLIKCQKVYVFVFLTTSNGYLFVVCDPLLFLFPLV